MTWSSSPNRWKNYNRSWSSARPTWKEGTSGQHGQNQGPEIWAGAWCTSEVWQRPLYHVSQGRRHKLHFLWWLFRLGPQEMQPLSLALWSLIPAPGIQCTRQARPEDDRPMTEVTEGRAKLEVVPSSCYLGDCLSSGGCCELDSITRCHVAWGKFNELLSVLTSRSFPITSRGRVYYSCVRSAMLHASETWAPTSSDLHHLQHNDPAMICWMCSVTTKDQVSSQDFLERMQLDNRARVLCTCSLRWYGHVEHSNAWLKKSWNSISQEVVAMAALRKPGQKWLAWTA